MKRTSGLLLALCVGAAASLGARKPSPSPLMDRLFKIRQQIGSLEESFVHSTQSQQGIQGELKKIKKLMSLQQLEQSLGQKRLAELSHTVHELELRRTQLVDKIEGQKKALRRYLLAIQASNQAQTVVKLNPLRLLEEEKLETPRRKVLGNLVDRGLKEIEILRVDLSDALQLEGQIQEEKTQLSYLYQDLKEQESVLELNQKLQTDLLKKKKTEHVSQYENYRKLKNAEGQVEKLITNFNARKELELAEESERANAQDLSMNQGFFYALKGKLPLPVSGGKVVSDFGRAFDKRTGLYIFKKGIEITAPQNSWVNAVSEGKVVFSGTLPNYGQVVILDHGNHYYTLCAHLGTVSRKLNEVVGAGDPIGQVGNSENPLYFEIRARNIAVNPLQWLFN